jgi:transposase
MIGKQERDQRTLFIAGDLADFIPGDHILKRVHKVLDLSWLRQAVAGSYCLDNGRPGIDPEAAVRLMLAGFYAGIKEDRKLMREAQVNLAMRWFAGYRLDEALPNHSSLTRIRQRWGEELFRQIFTRTVEACIAAGLVNGETVHIDATLIRADVSWGSITKKHAEQVWEANAQEERKDDSDPPPPTGNPTGQKDAQAKKSSPTDPDATLTTSRHDYPMEPSYKQHTVSDDRVGVIVDVKVTTGETSEGQGLLETVDRVEQTTGIGIHTVTADAGYAHPTNYEALEKRGVQAVIPPGPTRTKYTALPSVQFKYDARHQRVRCPRGKFLHRSSRATNGWVYRARVKDCRNCPLRPRCFSAKGKVRQVLIVDGYEALLRARRKKQQGWMPEWKRHYQRHRIRVEGAHGEAKTQHGLRRAARRGLWNVAIQVYLTAAVMNLKRLAMTFQKPPQPFCEPLRAVWHAIQSLGRAVMAWMSVWKPWRLISTRHYVIRAETS